jgi:hypothetical protein
MKSHGSCEDFLPLRAALVFVRSYEAVFVD